MTGAEPTDPGAVRELADLQESYEQVAALLDPEAALRRAAELVITQVGLPVALVGERRGEDAIAVRYTSGTRTDALQGVVVPAGKGLGGKVVALRRPAWVDDYPTSTSITHHYDPQVMTEGLHRMIAVPLECAGTFHGVLYGSGRTPGPLGDTAAAAMQRIAAQTAVSLQVAERSRHAAEIAVHEERRRIAIALHDSVGAMLFAIGAGARELAASLETLPAVAARAREIEERAASAAVALRKSLQALHTTPEQTTFCVTLRADANDFAARTGVAARVIELSDPPPLPATHSAALIGCLREALLNVEKHADADSVVVTCGAVDGGVALVVADDGNGCFADSAETGLGLQAVRERLARLGGRLHLIGNDEGGTTLRAWLPL